MERIIYMAILTLAIIQPIASQENAAPERKERVSKNYLYFSPVYVFANQFMIGYERDFNSKNGILLLPGILFSDNDDYGLDFGLTGEIHYRLHLLVLKNPRGKHKNPFRFNFYVSPFAQYQYFTKEYDPNSPTTEILRYNSAGGGLILGTRYVFLERLALDFYLGFGGKKSFGHQDYGGQYAYRVNYTGIIGKANLLIGVAF